MAESFLLHIYNTNCFWEFDLTKIALPKITMGSLKTNSIYVPGCFVNNGFIFFNKDATGIWLNANKQLVYKNGSLIEHKKIEAGDNFIIEQANNRTVVMIKNSEDFPLPTKSYFLDVSVDITIGRSNSNTISFNDRLVSELHATIYSANGFFYIKDIGSKNGTYVNGKKIFTQQLFDCDAITICGNKLFVSKGCLMVAADIAVSGLKPYRKNLPLYPYFQRPPRMVTAFPSGEISIMQPPQANIKPEINWLQVLLPSLGMLMFPLISLASGNSQLTSIAFLLTVPISIITSVYSYKSQIKKFEANENRRQLNYQQYIAKISEQLNNDWWKQRNLSIQKNPDFSTCLQIAISRTTNLWERIPSHKDFLSSRLGIGNTLFNVKIKVPDLQNGLEDDLLKLAPNLALQFNQITDVPIEIPLMDQGSVGVTGDRNAVIMLARNIIAFLATTHSYDEIKIGVVCSPSEYDNWNWLRWLPHNWDNSMQQRYFATNRKEVNKMFSSICEIVKTRELSMSNRDSIQSNISLPVYIIFIADWELVRNELLINYITQNNKTLGIIAFFLFDQYEKMPKECNCIISMNNVNGEANFRDGKTSSLRFKIENTTTILAEKLSRALAPVRLMNLTASETLPKSVSLFEMLGIDSLNEEEILQKWKRNEPYISIATEIGVGPGNRTYKLDLHEKAHGPHGLVAGTTGSGKSEFLQTLVLSLCLNFNPHEIAFILIDYKGGGMANVFKRLPHISGVITNLDGNQTNRALSSIKGEVSKRQTLFERSNVNHIDKYQKAVRNGTVFEPLPHLIIIVDEFAELKDERPDFISELVSTARVGRSLGIHLILATQKPSGVVDAQIWSNSRFRVCLKVQNSEDSREMLKRPDAASITTVGQAYFQVGNDEIFDLFQSAWSGSEFHEEGCIESNIVKEVDIDGTRHSLDKNIFKNDKKECCTELTYAVDKICSAANNARIKSINSSWLPPLSSRIALETIIGETKPKWLLEKSMPSYWATACVGLIDNPSSQAQYPLILNFAEEGHLFVAGAPSSGKTTFLKTLVVSLAMTNSPDDAWIYILDFGGRTMGMFEELPQCGSVIQPEEEDKVKSFVRFIGHQIDQRKRQFSSIGAASIQAFRGSGASMSAIFVVIDNIAALMELYPDLEDLLVQISREGGNLGVYLAISAHSSSSVKYKILSNIKRTIALKLTDRGEYTNMVGRVNFEPDNMPGRGLYKDSEPLEFQTALPADGVNEIEQSAKIRALGKLMFANWNGQTAEKLQVLPHILTIVNLNTFCSKDFPQMENTVIPVGMDIETVSPVYWQSESNHLLVAGQSRQSFLNCVKGLLRTVNEGMSSITDIYLIDNSSKELKEFASKPGINEYASTKNEISKIFSSIISYSENKETEQDENNSYKRLLVICDFKDFLNKAGTEEKTMLENLIRQPYQFGLRVLLAGTVADFAACWDGPGKAIKENCTGILMAEPNDQQVFTAIRLPYNVTSKLLKSDECYFIQSSGTTKIKLPVELN